VLVLDASVIVAACLTENGWDVFRAELLIAPILAHSEAASLLHEIQWRGELSPTDARAARGRLVGAPISFRAGTVEGPWDVADELGWAKTYDAEYVALAQVERCRLVTLDGRLKRSAGRIVEIIGPADLARSRED
jgi:predicted nucleic acid-binding protein